MKLLYKYVGILSSLLLIITLVSCENGDSHISDGHDFGDNATNIYVALGDSVTAGSYPNKLAVLLGSTVINAGAGGDSTAGGVSRLYPLLSNNKPGYVLVLLGVNDLIMGYGADNAVRNLRLILQATIDNKSIPVIATLPPVFYSHSYLTSAVADFNIRIRALADEMGVYVVDLEIAFAGNSAYISDDGLHPNDAGYQLIAVTFYDILR